MLLKIQLSEKFPPSERSRSLSSEGLEHLEEIKLCRCMYIQDACLERLSSIQNLQQSLFMMELVSCGNVTDKGVVALHRLRLVFMRTVTVSVRTAVSKGVPPPSPQEPGVSVSQRSPWNQRQAGDRRPTAEGAAAPGRLSGPGPVIELIHFSSFRTQRRFRRTVFSFLNFI